MCIPICMYALSNAECTWPRFGENLIYHLIAYHIWTKKLFAVIYKKCYFVLKLGDLFLFFPSLARLVLFSVQRCHQDLLRAPNNILPTLAVNPVLGSHSTLGTKSDHSYNDCSPGGFCSSSQLLMCETLKKMTLIPTLLLSFDYRR